MAKKGDAKPKTLNLFNVSALAKLDDAHNCRMVADAYLDLILKDVGLWCKSNGISVEALRDADEATISKLHLFEKRILAYAEAGRELLLLDNDPRTFLAGLHLGITLLQCKVEIDVAETKFLKVRDEGAARQKVVAADRWREPALELCRRLREKKPWLTQEQLAESIIDEVEGGKGTQPKHKSEEEHRYDRRKRIAAVIGKWEKSGILPKRVK